MGLAALAFETAGDRDIYPSRRPISSQEGQECEESGADKEAVDGQDRKRDDWHRV